MPVSAPRKTPTARMLDSRPTSAVSENIYFNTPVGGTAHVPAKFGTLTGIKTVWKDRAVEPNKPVPAGD